MPLEASPSVAGALSFSQFRGVGQIGRRVCPFRVPDPRVSPESSAHNRTAAATQWDNYPPQLEAGTPICCSVDTHHILLSVRINAILIRNK